MAGLKTFSEFKDELLLNLGVHDSDVYDSYKGGWINTAYLSFCARHQFYGLRLPRDFRFPELDTTSAKVTADGISYVQRPSDCLKIYTVFDETNTRKLTYMYLMDYVEKDDRSDTDNENEPEYWIPYGTKVNFYPTPDDAYEVTIYYRKKPTVLSADADTTAIGKEWDDLILQLATVQSLKRLKQYDELVHWQKDFVTNLREMMGIYDTQERDSEKVMEPHYMYLKRDWK